MDKQLQKLVNLGLEDIRAEKEVQDRLQEQARQEAIEEANAAWAALDKAAHELIPEAFHPYIDIARERQTYDEDAVPECAMPSWRYPLPIQVPGWTEIEVELQRHGDGWRFYTTRVKRHMEKKRWLRFFDDIKEFGSTEEMGPWFLDEDVRVAPFKENEWHKVAAFASQHGKKQTELEAEVKAHNAKEWAEWREQEAQKGEVAQETQPPTNLSSYQRLKVARESLYYLQEQANEETYARLGTPMALEAIAQILLAATTEDGRIRLSQVTDEF